jgi:hypothetical protein
MRLLLTITVLILVGESYGQQKEVKVKLADNITLTFLKDTFDPKGKKIEISDKVVISIDNKLVFGTDGEMPRTYLKKATLTIGTKNFDLQVDGMYNPWHEDFFNDKVFKLKTEGAQYKVIGGFSDGAGYYGAEWIVFGQGCIRTILTNEEKILFEYMEDQ